MHLSFPSRAVVIIPALNEALAIRATIHAWRRLGFERIRVVDNGSIDGTATAAREAGAEVIVEPQRGYGAAAWRGTQGLPASVEWILFSSADGSDRLELVELAEWQAALDAGDDLVIGDRVSHPESRRHLKAIQSWGNRVCCACLAWGWGARFNDMGSLRLIRRAAFERLDLQDRGFGWNIEMQVRALERGLVIREIPVRYFPRSAGESKISGSWRGTFRAGAAFFGMFSRLWWQKVRRAGARLALSGWRRTVGGRNTGTEAARR